MDLADLDIVIIGSGWAGICTMKHCIEEKLKGIILEKNNDYGGVWNIQNSPSVYANTYSVTSKYYLSMSDFPIPESYPEFPHHTLVMDYMRMYARNFVIEKHICFGSEVIHTEKKGTLWHVTYTKGNTKHTITARNIAICTGQNSSCKNYPRINTSRFKGKIYHASEYNDKLKDECLNKKVLIYGGSDTAFDIAVDLTNSMYKIKKEEGNIQFGYTGKNGTISNTKTTVYVSMRKGRWIQRRTTGTYAPADMFYNRIFDGAFKNISKSLVYSFFTPFLELFWGKSGSGVPEWETDAGYLNSYYVKSADILPRITYGDIIPLRDVSFISKNTIITVDAKQYDVDIIIFATGYSGLSCFTWVPDNIKKGKFYDHIFLVEDPSVAKIGFIRPFLTSIPMVIEMQTRYVAKVFSKQIQLPEDIVTEYDKMKKQQSLEFSYDYERVSGIIDPYDYMNMISIKIGAYPSLVSMIFTDPVLLYFILFHTWSHFIYRPNDPIAREQILHLGTNISSINISFVTLLITVSICILCLVIHCRK
jgi:dimethylaniline monooxygenase (N-oxide forming)